jgi:hypothetical protein
MDTLAVYSEFVYEAYMMLGYVTLVVLIILMLVAIFVKVEK